uniref:ZP domain-containing protein n=1 Tax=Ditylenchus dipsaci TaxID=166011 RepID=A0A915EKL2_9BILA
MLLLLIGLLFVGSLLAIPIPNGQVGRAEVECGEESIEVVFLTEDLFQGRVFVVGHANDTNCVSREVGRKSTSITVRRDQCGVATIRSQNPPGLFINVKIMISFHDEFITKVDRGYEISCFYMQSEKTVTFPISVSPNTLQPLTELAEMPQCRYEVVDPVTQLPVSVVSVGSKLLHKWICDSTAPNLWCMTVHSCFVEDGSGTEFVILNDQGCAIDRYLLDNLEYGPGPLQAQKEAHAFKFADRVVVNFQCSIRLDIRDGECAIPKCPDLSKQKPRITKRSLVDAKKTKTSESFGVSEQGFTELDVRAPKLDVLDPQIGFGAGTDEPTLSRLGINSSGRQGVKECVPLEILIVPASFAITLIVALLAALFYLVWTPSRDYKSKNFIFSSSVWSFASLINSCSFPLSVLRKEENCFNAQPNSKVLFNAPYDDKHTYHIKVRSFC